MKRCANCKRLLPVGSYWANKKSRDGLASWCKSCTRENNRAYQKAHQEKCRERVRLWAQKNPERARESQRRWKEKNPEKMRAYRKKCDAKNPKRIKAARRTYIKKSFAARGSDLARNLAHWFKWYSDRENHLETDYRFIELQKPEIFEELVFATGNPLLYRQRQKERQEDLLENSNIPKLLTAYHSGELDCCLALKKELEVNHSLELVNECPSYGGMRSGAI